METEKDQASECKWQSAAWADEWMRQATPATMEGALAYAARRLAGQDGLTCGLTPAELVHDAVVATCDGVIRWRPDRVTLCAHLCDRIRVLLRRMRRMAARTVQLDHLAEHGEAQQIERDALSYSVDLDRQIDVRTAAGAIGDALWKNAAGDQPALAFLNAVAAGADNDRDIVELTGLPISKVRGARARLQRMVRALPRAVREPARSLTL